MPKLAYNRADMFGGAHSSVSLTVCLFSLSAAVVSCAHPGPDTCGGYDVERQWDKQFRVTLTAKVTEPPRWKLDEDGDPSPASFGGAGVEEARARYQRLLHQRCIELGFHESEGRARLEARATKEVTSVSTCVDPGAHGQRYYAIRIWGDRITCQYVRYL